MQRLVSLRFLAPAGLALLLSACIPGAKPDPAPPPPAPPPAEAVAEPAQAAPPPFETNRVRVNAVESVAATYTVVRGDTLRAISTKTNAGSEAIARENGLAPPFVIRPGQRLRIPAGRWHLVEAGETGIAIARAYGVEWQRVAELNALTEPYILRTGQRLRLPSASEVAAMSIEQRAQAFRLDIGDIITGGEPAIAEAARPVTPVETAPRTAPLPSSVAVAPPPATPSSFAGRFDWPLTGSILRGFGAYGSGRRNDGINIRVDDGAPIMAAADGVVTYAGTDLAAYGGLILIRHGSSWTTAYGHAGELLVTRGQAVRKGQVIGRAGATGTADTPQLHFEIRQGARPVDPLRHLPSAGVIRPRLLRSAAPHAALRRKSPLPVWASLLLRVALAFALIGVALGVHWFDREGLRDNIDGHVSFTDVLYFTMITVTTVGFGDIVPVTDRARMFDTFVVTPVRLFVWLIFLGTAYDFLFKRTWERWRMSRIQKQLTGHIVVTGFGTSGSEAVRELIARGADESCIVVIDPRAAALAAAEELGCAVIEGDSTRDATLQAVHIERASALIISAGRDDTSILIVLTARRLAPHLPISVVIRSEDNEGLAKQAGATTVINPVSFAGLLLAGSTHGPHIADYLADLAAVDGRVALRERAVTQAEIGRQLREIDTGLGVRIYRDGAAIDGGGVLAPGDVIVEIVGTSNRLAHRGG